MLRLSIIVPIYNVDPYVDRCIRSLENQDISHNDFEIICINDGSTDNSHDIVVGLEKEFDNIVLIDQTNQGASRARNKGIDEAKGEYLMFIDADDYVCNNCFASILKNADDHKVQVSFLGFVVINEDGTIRKRLLFEKQKGIIFQGTEAYYIAQSDGRDDPARMVAVLFDKDFINLNNLRYLPNVHYLEDGEFIARILCLSERCIFDSLPFYQRTSRPGSATNSNLFFSEKATQGFLLAANNLKRFQQSQNLNKKQINFLNQPICKFVVLVFNSIQKPFSMKRMNTAKAKLNELGLNRLNLVSVDKELAVLGYFYNRSVYLLIIYQFLIKSCWYIRLFVFKNRA